MKKFILIFLLASLVSAQVSKFDIYLQNEINKKVELKSLSSALVKYRLFESNIITGYYFRDVPFGLYSLYVADTLYIDTVKAGTAYFAQISKNFDVTGQLKSRAIPDTLIDSSKIKKSILSSTKLTQSVIDMITEKKDSSIVSDTSNFSWNSDSLDHHPATWFEPAFIKKTAFNRAFGNDTGTVVGIGSYLNVGQIVETDGSSKLKTVGKKTAYNLDFGYRTGEIPSIGNEFSASQIVETNADKELRTTAKKNAYNLDFGASNGAIPEIESYLSSSSIVETNSVSKLKTATKKSDYNLDLGTTSGTVAEGNHNHNSLYHPLISGALSDTITFNDGINNHSIVIDNGIIKSWTITP